MISFIADHMEFFNTCCVYIITVKYNMFNIDCKVLDLG